MRLSEMTDEQLIKQIEDDALAREIFNRLVLSKLRVSDEVQSLEHQRDKAMSTVEDLRDEIAGAEQTLQRYQEECARNQLQIKQFVLAAPSGKVAIHSSILERSLADVSLQWYTEERQGYDGWFLCVEDCRREAPGD